MEQLFGGNNGVFMVNKMESCRCDFELVRYFTYITAGPSGWQACTVATQSTCCVLWHCGLVEEQHAAAYDRAVGK